MMEEVVLEGEVEGGGSLNNKEEEEQESLSGSILKDDSIVLFEAGEEKDNEKDFMGGAPDLEEDPALKAPVTTVNSTTFKHQEDHTSKGVDSDANLESSYNSASQSADTIVQLLSKQQATEKAADEEKNANIEEEGGKNEANDQKIVIELLRQQVRSLSLWPSQAMLLNNIIPTK